MLKIPKIKGKPIVAINHWLLNKMYKLFKINIRHILKAEPPECFCYLITPKYGLIYPMIIGNQKEKDIFKSMIYDECLKKNASVAIFMYDAWYSMAPVDHINIEPRLDPNRREALQINIIRDDGISDSLVARYDRDQNNKAVFEDTAIWISTTGKVINGFINPWKGKTYQ